MIRLVTWNLWAFDTDRATRRRAILETLKRIDPDIGCLQEVRSDGVEDLAATVGHSLGLFVERTEPVASEWWQQRLGDRIVEVSNTLLSRWPTSDRWTLPLPFDDAGGERRSALLVRVATPMGPVLGVVTQLTSSPLSSALRTRQVRAIAQGIVQARHADDLVVLAGDLNAEPDSDEVRLLCGHKTAPAAEGLVLMDAWRFAAPSDPGWTWDRRNPYVAVTGEPDSRIDYILLGPLPSGRLPAVTSVDVIGAEPWDGTWASDHSAVVVEIEAPARGGPAG